MTDVSFWYARRHHRNRSSGPIARRYCQHLSLADPCRLIRCRLRWQLLIVNPFFGFPYSCYMLLWEPLKGSAIQPFRQLFAGFFCLLSSDHFRLTVPEIIRLVRYSRSGGTNWSDRTCSSVPGAVRNCRRNFCGPYPARYPQCRWRRCPACVVRLTSSIHVSI
jgi:hypothetical protein